MKKYIILQRPAGSRISPDSFKKVGEVESTNEGNALREAVDKGIIDHRERTMSKAVPIALWNEQRRKAQRGGRGKRCGGRR